MKTKKIIAIFDRKKYAKDFVAYQEIISESDFEIEELSLADWLLQPREF